MNATLPFGNTCLYITIMHAGLHWAVSCILKLSFYCCFRCNTFTAASLSYYAADDHSATHDFSRWA